MERGRAIFVLFGLALWVVALGLGTWLIAHLSPEFYGVISSKCAFFLSVLKFSSPPPDPSCSTFVPPLNLTLVEQR